MKNEWDMWDESVHNQEKQRQRIERGAGWSCTPFSVDADNKSGIFWGTENKYKTTLSNCTCIDFSRRHLPCKHMYRLAMELNIMEHEYCTDTWSVERKYSLEHLDTKTAVLKIETVSHEAQELFLSILYDILYNNKSDFCVVDKSAELNELFDIDALELKPDIDDNDIYEILNSYKRNELNQRISAVYDGSFKKNMSKVALLDWIKTEIPELIHEICNTRTIVCVGLAYSKNTYNIYKYLNRIKCYNYDFSSLPDDYITKLLIENNRITVNPINFSQQDNIQDKAQNEAQDETRDTSYDQYNPECINYELSYDIKSTSQLETATPKKSKLLQPDNYKYLALAILLLMILYVSLR